MPHHLEGFQRRFSPFLLPLLAVFFIEPAQASNYFGRITTGGFYTNENYGPNNGGLLNDNYAVLSSRFYLMATDLYGSRIDFNSDLRDKNDFFDNVSQPNLTLTPVNKFQAYQLNLKLQNRESGLYGTAGRFYTNEAGGIFTDGAEVGYKWSPLWRTGVFGGLNPKTPDQQYVGFNSNATDFGTYTIHQPIGFGRAQNLYFTDAVVDEITASQTERLYWYNNLIYQWDAPNQLVLMAYLDFVPSFYVQTALLNYRQQLAPGWQSSVSLSAIDNFQYQRQQNILERLPSSAYHEGAVNLRRELATWNLDANFLYGHRQLDSMNKVEGSAGPSFPRLFDAHYNLRTLAGARKNFNSNDEFAQAFGGYYSRDWETDLNVTYALSSQTGGYVLHQWMEEISLSRFYSRSWMFNFVVQHGSDEIVSLWGGLLKVSYTFGERDTSPVRETAPVPLPPTPLGRVY